MKKKDIFFSNNFITKIIENDLKKKNINYIYTRFAPEPNGHIHIGHAKSIFLNFGLAKKYNGKCNLRFDDTNPEKENSKYIQKIKKDIKWLGFKWNGKVRYTSDYFEKIYAYAIKLIKKKLAYVDNLNQKQIREFRGTLTNPGTDSPYRNRTIKENLFLFEKMKNGSFKEGEVCLRAKINMQSHIILFRDPILYRIKFKKHHQTGDRWCIYPMYDFSHCISDAIEGITHSFCTLEFLNNKKLYNWFLNNLEITSRPYQYEFSRLKLQYTIMSKRKLKNLISNKIINTWDDPRIATISGLRRRGYTVSSIQDFCYKTGISKQESTIEISLLEFCIRNHLNQIAFRAMAVLNPVKIIFNNIPHGFIKILSIPNHPYKPEMGFRKVYFSKEIFIEKSDFQEKESLNYKRLVLGKKVRLRHAYTIQAESVQKDQNGNINFINCICDLHTKNFKNNNKIGIIHWVSSIYGIPAKFYLYKHLFKIKNPDKYDNVTKYVNKSSLKIRDGFVEPSVKKRRNKHYQFERLGYFYIDKKNSSKEKKITFNRTIGLINTFKKKEL